MWKATCTHCEETETVQGDFKSIPTFTKFYLSWLCKDTKALFCKKCGSQAYSQFLGK